MQWTKYREVVLEPAAQRAADEFRGSLNRFEEAFLGLEWLLSRVPDRGLRRTVNGTTYRLYVQAGDALADTPEITVLFEFDDRQVIVHAVRAVENGVDELELNND
jgi:hypothetical protein